MTKNETKLVAKKDFSFTVPNEKGATPVYLRTNCVEGKEIKLNLPKGASREAIITNLKTEKVI